MTFQRFQQYLESADCFRSLEHGLAAEPKEHQDFPLWAQLLVLDDLQAWLMQSEFMKSHFCRNPPTALGTVLVQQILKRRLLDLRTRQNPAKLVKFWKWAVDGCSAEGRMAEVWGPYHAVMTATFVSFTEKSVMEQEAEYALILRRIAATLETCQTPARLRWASETMRSLAAERSLEIKGAGSGKIIPKARALVSIAFAWNGDGAHFPFLRPGLMVPLELQSKLARTETVNGSGWLTVDPSCTGEHFRTQLNDTEQVFEKSFADSMIELWTERGDCFPLSLPTGIILPAFQGKFSGGSGKLAVGTVQELGNIDSRWENYHAIPPYVLIEATASPQNGNTAGPVGLLEKKVELLLEEGIRIVAVSTQQGAIMLPAWAYGKIHVLANDWTYPKLATHLRKLGYVWPANLKAKDQKRWPSRKEVIYATIGIALICLLSIFGGALWHREQNLPERTDAMVVHDAAKGAFQRRNESVVHLIKGKTNLDYLSLLNGLGIQVKTMALPRGSVIREGRSNIVQLSSAQVRLLDDTNLLNESDDYWNSTKFPLAAVRERLKTKICRSLGCNLNQLIIAEIPDGVDLHGAGFDTVSDSKVIDNSQWRQVMLESNCQEELPQSSEDALHRLPWEPAFFSRKLQLRRIGLKTNLTSTIYLKMNTTGYGIIPLGNETGDFLIFVDAQPESNAPYHYTITVLFKQVITNFSSADVAISLNAIYYNGWQDQSVRNIPTDWWGTREELSSNTLHLDYAIAVARSHPLSVYGTERDDVKVGIAQTNNATNVDYLMVKDSQSFFENDCQWKKFYLSIPSKTNPMVFNIHGTWHVKK